MFEAVHLIPIQLVMAEAQTGAHERLQMLKLPAAVIMQLQEPASSLGYRVRLSLGTHRYPSTSIIISIHGCIAILLLH